MTPLKEELGKKENRKQINKDQVIKEQVKWKKFADQEETCLMCPSFGTANELW